MNKLGVCVQCQDLKDENLTLRHENDELHAELERLTMHGGQSEEETGPRQRSQGHGNVSNHSGRHHGQFAQARDRDGRKQNSATKRDDPTKSTSQKSRQQERATDEQYDALFSLDLSSLSAHKHDRRSTRKATSENPKKLERKRSNTSMQRSKKVTLNDQYDTDVTEDTNTKGKDFTNQTGVSEDVTFLSFIDVSLMNYNCYHLLGVQFR